MSLESIVAGDYGQSIELTFVDVDTEAPADISAYTTAQQMIFTAPDGTETVKTAAYKTDGSDGIVTYTVEVSFLTAGVWQVRGRVTTGSARLTTEVHKFEVIE